MEKKRRISFAFFLAVLLILTGCGNSDGDVEPVHAGCGCNCNVCIGTPSGNTLFSFPTDSPKPQFILKMLHLITEDRYVVLENEDVKAALDILNAFVPLDPAGEAVEDGWSDPEAVDVDVIYVDFWRDLQLVDDSVVVCGRKYTGPPGCLEPLYDMFEEADAVKISQ